MAGSARTRGKCIHAETISGARRHLGLAPANCKHTHNTLEIHTHSHTHTVTKFHTHPRQLHVRKVPRLALFSAKMQTKTAKAWRSEGKAGGIGGGIERGKSGEILNLNMFFLPIYFYHFHSFVLALSLLVACPTIPFAICLLDLFFFFTSSLWIFSLFSYPQRRVDRTAISLEIGELLCIEFYP